MFHFWEGSWHWLGLEILPWISLDIISRFFKIFVQSWKYVYSFWAYSIRVRTESGSGLSDLSCKTDRYDVGRCFSFSIYAIHKIVSLQFLQLIQVNFSFILCERWFFDYSRYFNSIVLVSKLTLRNIQTNNILFRNQVSAM